MFMLLIIYLVLIICIVFIIKLIIKSVNINNVKKYSKLLSELNQLNQIYASKFYPLSKKYFIKNECNSLQKFRINCNDSAIVNFMCLYVKEDENYWKNLCATVHYNNSLYRKYKSYLETIKRIHLGKSYDENSKHFPFLSKKRYLIIEEKLFQDLQLKPIIDLCVILTVSYTSPAGRNRYVCDFQMDVNSIEYVFKKIDERKKFEESVKYQRQLMTNAKRYEILKRDHFCCQICGRTQSDGAKLEVDHIIPVSKGGKTVNENLRTLCHECNQGKGNQYE